MKKMEMLWREILFKTLTGSSLTFTQKELAHQFKISTSTVFHALKAPRKLGAIEVTGRCFRLRDAEKLLLLWATHRQLKKDIIYETFVDASVLDIEGAMPPEVIFGAFSAYRFRYHEAPADYDHVYVYAEDLSAIQKRFPKRAGYPNLFVLKLDPYLQDFGPITPDVQMYVDFWNLSEWYSKDFLEKLKMKMGVV